MAIGPDSAGIGPERDKVSFRPDFARNGPESVLYSNNTEKTHHTLRSVLLLYDVAFGTDF